MHAASDSASDASAPKASGSAQLDPTGSRPEQTGLTPGPNNAFGGNAAASPWQTQVGVDAAAAAFGSASTEAWFTRVDNGADGGRARQGVPSASIWDTQGAETDALSALFGPSPMVEKQPPVGPPAPAKSPPVAAAAAPKILSEQFGQRLAAAPAQAHAIGPSGGRPDPFHAPAARRLTPTAALPSAYSETPRNYIDSPQALLAASSWPPNDPSIVRWPSATDGEHPASNGHVQFGAWPAARNVSAPPSWSTTQWPAQAVVGPRRDFAGPIVGTSFAAWHEMPQHIAYAYRAQQAEVAALRARLAMLEHVDGGASTSDGTTAAGTVHASKRAGARKRALSAGAALSSARVRASQAQLVAPVQPSGGQRMTPVQPSGGQRITPVHPSGVQRMSDPISSVQNVSDANNGVEKVDASAKRARKRAAKKASKKKTAAAGELAGKANTPKVAGKASAKDARAKTAQTAAEKKETAEGASSSAVTAKATKAEPKAKAKGKAAKIKSKSAKAKAAAKTKAKKGAGKVDKEAAAGATEEANETAVEANAPNRKDRPLAEADDRIAALAEGRNVSNDEPAVTKAKGKGKRTPRKAAQAQTKSKMNHTDTDNETDKLEHEHATAGSSGSASASAKKARSAGQTKSKHPVVGSGDEEVAQVDGEEESGTKALRWFRVYPWEDTSGQYIANGQRLCGLSPTVAARKAVQKGALQFALVEHLEPTARADNDMPTIVAAEAKCGPRRGKKAVSEHSQTVSSGQTQSGRAKDVATGQAGNGGTDAGGRDGAELAVFFFVGDRVEAPQTKAAGGRVFTVNTRPVVESWAKILVSVDKLPEALSKFAPPSHSRNPRSNPPSSQRSGASPPGGAACFSHTTLSPAPTSQQAQQGAAGEQGAKSLPAREAPTLADEYADRHARAAHAAHVAQVSQAFRRAAPIAPPPPRPARAAQSPFR
jgi:hypothetical protein